MDRRAGTLGGVRGGIRGTLGGVRGGISGAMAWITGNFSDALGERSEGDCARLRPWDRVVVASRAPQAVAPPAELPQFWGESFGQHPAVRHPQHMSEQERVAAARNCSRSTSSQTWRARRPFMDPSSRLSRTLKRFGRCLLGQPHATHLLA